MKLLKPLLWLWPFYITPANWSVVWFYTSFGAKHPSRVGYKEYSAEHVTDALYQAQHDKTVTNKHNPLYPGKYNLKARKLTGYQRIRFKWFKKKAA